ncbi:hypothetical protein N7535_008240 [Penicillium sp. DV-2018c]|nr:hypothetical protein N7461_004278 [Penicillium sp. DV-2018c]KAJ5566602.1 hypothetical protein N7535_008240 [Penicillium sp. DV-2018c]
MQQQEAAPSSPDHEPGTPPRPPYSPVTPVFAQLVPLPSDEPRIVPPPASPSPRSHFPSPGYPDYSQHTPPANPPVFKPQPPPVPISDSENPDAIALRSAISILQMQKQQSLRDIQALHRLKDSAAADPERFAHQLATGKLKTEDHGTVIQFSENVATDDEDEEADAKSTNLGHSPASDFGHIPNPQNVVRMPPINWGKYQVVGESLDRLHEEQLHRPSPGEPGSRAPEYLLASPYRPLVDQLATPKSGRPSKAKKT